MPLYEYKCSNCGHSFSEYDKMYIKDRQVDCQKCRNENRDKPVKLKPINITSEKIKK